MSARAGLILAFAIVCASCGGDDAVKPNRDTPSALEQAITMRVEVCLNSGATEANCECRADLVARHLPLGDFQEETRILQTNDQMALNDFNRRMLAENRDLMFRLGQALTNCPPMRL